MEVEKLKELREIAHRDSAVSLTVRAADLRALLDEVEALRAALDKAAIHIAAIGYPVGANGRYQKGGEWTFSDACPRQVDAAEVKQAFLTICAARHELKATQP